MLLIFIVLMYLESKFNLKNIICLQFIDHTINDAICNLNTFLSTKYSESTLEQFEINWNKEVKIATQKNNEIEDIKAIREFIALEESKKNIKVNDELKTHWFTTFITHYAITRITPDILKILYEIIKNFFNK